MTRLAPLVALLLFACPADPDDSGKPADTADTATGDTADTTDTGGDTDTALDGGELYARHCENCHAADGTGASGPNIVGDLARQTDEEIISIILNGRGQEMPPINVTEAEAQMIVDWMRASF